MTSDLNILLLGGKLSHSLSPEIHSFFADYSYRLKELSPDELGEFFSSADFDGLNVTIPFKNDVMKFIDCLSQTAERIGAVNTVVKRDGLLYGYNTDYYGFGSLLDHYDVNLSGKKVVILGSGGASQAVRVVAEDKNAREIVVVSRNGENNYQNIDKHFDSDIIVNATPVGMFPLENDSPVNIEVFGNLECVVDLIYNPLKTDFLLNAEQNNIKAVNGLYMLVAQAKKSAELFLNRDIDTSLVPEIVRKITKKFRNIALIGMPGCGKTTVGRLLSERLGLQFVDTDIMFEEKFGISAGEYIKLYGEPAFREKESECVDCCSLMRSCVISTGGGCVTVPENMRKLKRNSLIVYIDKSTEALCTDGRPLSVDINDIYNNRLPLYNKYCDLHVCGDKEIVDIVNDIEDNYETFDN